VDAEEQKLMKAEHVKKYTKEINNMEMDRPKLYGQTRKHMSMESVDEASQQPWYDQWSKALDPEKLWQAIVLTRNHMFVESVDEVSQQPGYDQWSKELDPEKFRQAIVLTHKVNCGNNVKQVTGYTARKACQGICQGAFETLAQYSKRFRETLKTYKATRTMVDPMDVNDAEQAMDFFFHGLDPERYGSFKMEILNGWNLKAFNPPAMANKLYKLMGSWVKTTSKIEGSTVSTYVTIEEDARQ
jgi:hypothetical protein